MRKILNATFLYDLLKVQVRHRIFKSKVEEDISLARWLKLFNDLVDDFIGNAKSLKELAHGFLTEAFIQLLQDYNARKSFCT